MTPLEQFKGSDREEAPSNFVIPTDPPSGDQGHWLEYHHDPVLLHSGQRSHWLVRGDLIFQDIHLRAVVLARWMKALEVWRPPLEIVSIPTGGDVWAEALRREVANRPKSVGDSDSSVGYRIVVDGVVTTGVSIFSDPAAHLRLAVVDRRTHRRGRGGREVVAWATLHLPYVETI